MFGYDATSDIWSIMNQHAFHNFLLLIFQV